MRSVGHTTCKSDLLLRIMLPKRFCGFGNRQKPLDKISGQYAGWTMDTHKAERLVTEVFLVFF